MKERIHRLRLRIFPPGSRAEARLAPLLDLLRETAANPPESRLARLLPGPLRRAWSERFHAALLQRLPARDLRAILDGHAGRTPVLFSPGLPWPEVMFQRPQQLARALARSGALVFYCLPEGTATPSGEPFHALEEGLYLAAAPVETFWILHRPLTYTLTWNRLPTLALDRPRLLYDHLDDLRILEGDLPRMTREHARLLRQAERVFVSARALLEAVESARPDAVLLPNAVDYAAFARARLPAGAELPADLAPLVERAGPLLIYTGALARWFDAELVRSVARARPAWTWVLIGPDYDGTLAASGLAQEPNVAWLGPKPYHALPDYLAFSDVATIPFQVTALTRAVSPVKLFEYFAAGKPVVSTPLPECAAYAPVQIADGPPAFIAAVERALALKDEPAYLQSLDQLAQENTWAARARQLLASVEGA